MERIATLKNIEFTYDFMVKKEGWMGKPKGFLQILSGSEDLLIKKNLYFTVPYHTVSVHGMLPVFVILISKNINIRKGAVCFPIKNRNIFIT